MFVSNVIPVARKPVRNPMAPMKERPDDPREDDSFGWVGALVSATIQAGSAAYQIDAQKDMQKRSEAHQEKLANIARKVEKKRIALERKKLGVMAKAKKGDWVGVASDPSVYLPFAGVALGVGALVYYKMR